MKNTILPLALAAAGLFVVPAVSHAQALDGAFVNGNLGRAALDSGAIDDKETSYGVNIGYRWAVSPGALIGFEAGYVDLGSSSFPASITQLFPIGTPPTEPTTYFGSGSRQLSGWTIGANGRFNLSPNWYIGGRAGFLRLSADTRIRINRPDGSVFKDRSDYHADGWYAGAGVGYDFSNHLSVGLNYDYYSASKYGYRNNPDVISVSGEYRF